MKLKHSDRIAARTELVENAYTPAFNSPGRPELWKKSKDKRGLAIARERSTGLWHIVPYPEPAVCKPEEARALAERDGIVLQGGKLPVTAELSADETAWLD